MNEIYALQIDSNIKSLFDYMSHRATEEEQQRMYRA